MPSKSHSHSFDLAVSLGASCRTRYQIERVQKAKYGIYDMPSFFFDWTWTPKQAASVTAAIRNRFSLSHRDFMLKPVGEVYQACCETYDLYFMHDFDFIANDLALAQTELAPQLDAVVARYARRKDRMLRLLHSDLKTLFVLSGYRLDATETDDLVDALLAINPRAQFEIANIVPRDVGAPAPQNPYVFCIEIDEDFVKWSGNDAAYDEVFSALTIAPRVASFAKKS